MKNILLITTLAILTATQSGCVCLRYTYEPAVNEVAKKGTITRITNDYIEYNVSSTNIIESRVVKTDTYRAYYGDAGKIYKTKKIER
tara:strand:+ start:1862 stop:2122 length:261 start_codon:yes stop_codon:yes gene_type:complete